MTTVLALLRERSRGRRPQSGFSLIAVLTAIAVFSIIVVALLSLLFTDVGFRSVTREAAASSRAVDGALEAATSQLAGAGVTGSFGDSCRWTGVGSAVLPIDVDGTSVSVECSFLEPDVNGPPVPIATGRAVTLTGSYSTVVPRLVQQLDTQIAAFNAQIAATTDPIARWGLEQQRNLLQNVKDQLVAAAASGWGLIHVANQALRVLGDVAVARGAGALNPAAQGALSIQGRYRQGTIGWLGNVDAGPWYAPSLVRTTPCGALVRNQNVPLNVSLGWFRYFPELWIDAELGPNWALPSRLDQGNPRLSTCGNPTDTFFADPFGSPSARSAPTWSGGEQRHALPATCAPNAAGVVTFSPGIYDSDATDVLNRWFRGEGCGDVTFWFPPGDYYFDVIGGDIMDGSLGALRFDNPNARWVFGAPRGWDPAVAQPDASNFPAACATGSRDLGANEGVTVTLSGRTTLAHVRGLVAMCARRLANGDQVVLVEQQTPAAGATVKWAAEPSTAATSPPLYTEGPPFSNPSRATATVAGARPPQFPPRGDAYDASEAGSAGSPPVASVSCGNSCDPQLVLGGFGHSGSLPPSGEVSGMTLHLRGRANVRVSKDPAVFPLDPNYQCPPDGCSGTTVLVDHGGGAPCVVTVPDVLDGERDAFVISSIDLSSCVGPGRVDDSGQVDDLTITVQPKLRCVEYHLPGPEGGVEPICHPMDQMTFEIDYAWIDVDLEGVGEPAALSAQVDVAAGDPARRNSITFFGPVHVPHTDVEVQWRGSAWAMPIFAGGVVARGLASWTVLNGTAGVLASPDVEIGQDRVLLRARRHPGRLAGSAVVSLETPLVGPAGRRIEDWALCSADWDAHPEGCPG